MNHCPDCDQNSSKNWTRRQFVQTVGATAAVAATSQLTSAAEASPQASETLVKKLYDSLQPGQKEKICFAWDHTDQRGQLRSHVANNWHITEQRVASEFFTKDQQDLIEAIFWGLYQPDWKDRIKRQLSDDAGGYGKQQSIAIFGEPGTGKFEFVMTGRHLTIRCDGDSTEHVAFGGPIFYGHAAHQFNEAPNHPDNVFWYQALKANELYKMLDGKQREQALIPETVEESAVQFRSGDIKPVGLPIGELSKDQREHAEKVLAALLEPYRQIDQEEVRRCLQAQGGLEKCKLAFFADSDLGNDQVWDVWRIEGPSFVWHYRGNPHVHVWVNVADDPNVRISLDG
ncbi:MAG: DUF3500 domain-containing protein [Planctomycetaceae bacterium]